MRDGTIMRSGPDHDNRKINKTSDFRKGREWGRRCDWKEEGDEKREEQHNRLQPKRKESKWLERVCACKKET